MATISFWAGETSNIANLAGSGLGFYNSASFGSSVPVGQYNGRTFITDSTGTSQGPEVDNNKYNGASGVIIGQAGSGISLLSLPNYLATLNVRFTHGSSVSIQNAKIYAYDRVSKNNNPSGVTVYAADVVHPPTVQGPTGSGDAGWTAIAGSGSTLTLVDSPGTSGYSPNGSSTSDTQHDWYVALSVSPTSVGAKEFGLWCELEYL